MSTTVTARPLILAVDDEPGIRRILDLELSTRGFDLVSASTAADALATIADATPDAILLDIVLPDRSGLDLLPEIRRLTLAPVVLLTARDREFDRRRGLSSGADAYIVKPFAADELAELLRRLIDSTSGPDGIVQAGGIEIDVRMRTAYHDGDPIRLSATEWHILEQLAASANTPIPYAELLSAVWGADHATDLEFLHAWIARLKSRLKLDDETLTDRPGEGYLLIARHVTPGAATP